MFRLACFSASSAIRLAYLFNPYVPVLYNNVDRAFTSWNQLLSGLNPSGPDDMSPQGNPVPKGNRCSDDEHSSVCLREAREGSLCETKLAKDKVRDLGLGEFQPCISSKAALSSPEAASCAAGGWNHLWNQFWCWQGICGGLCVLILYFKLGMQVS